MPLNKVRCKTREAPPQQVMDLKPNKALKEDVTIDPALEKRILVEMMAEDLKARDDKLDELKFLNDEMRRGYEDQIRILKDLSAKSASNPDAEQIKKMIERKEKQITELMTVQDEDVRPDNVYVEKATKALREDVPALVEVDVKKKKNGQRPLSALKKPNAVQKIWK